jgi:hypothetical protein
MGTNQYLYPPKLSVTQNKFNPSQLIVGPVSKFAKRNSNIFAFVTPFELKTKRVCEHLLLVVVSLVS